MDIQATDKAAATGFETANRGFSRVFRPGALSLGLVVPVEAYPNSAVPVMEQHIERVQLAESLGFASVWLRDVPLNVPSFGDAGQVFDPFVYLGVLAAQTSSIALGVASIILTLRHPVHVAKAAHSADVLSGGRVILGVASGDRPEEFPALGMSYEDRGERFREAFTYLRKLAAPYPRIESTLGRMEGRADMLPRPSGARLPLLITGSSQQAPEWIAAHGDGWMTYPRPALQQAQIIRDYRSQASREGHADKPVMEPLYIDLAENPDEAVRPIHLGFRLGVNGLREYLAARQAIGVNHVALNLRFNQRDIHNTLETLAKELLPHFAHEE